MCRARGQRSESRSECGSLAPHAGVGAAVRRRRTHLEQADHDRAHRKGEDVHDPVTGQGMNIYDTFPAETVRRTAMYTPPSSQPGATSSRIVVARSQNGGRTWSTRYLGVRGQAALPTVEVAGDGTVAVTYYKVSAASSNGFWPTQVIGQTRDQGGTWSHQPIGRQFNLLSAGSKARPCSSSATMRAWRACRMAWSQRPRSASHWQSTWSTFSLAASPRREGDPAGAGAGLHAISR